MGNNLTKVILATSILTSATTSEAGLLSWIHREGKQLTSYCNKLASKIENGPIGKAAKRVEKAIGVKSQPSIYGEDFSPESKKGLLDREAPSAANTDVRTGEAPRTPIKAVRRAAPSTPFSAASSVTFPRTPGESSSPESAPTPYILTSGSYDPSTFAVSTDHRPSSKPRKGRNAELWAESVEHEEKYRKQSHDNVRALFPADVSAEGGEGGGGEGCGAPSEKFFPKLRMAVPKRTGGYNALQAERERRAAIGGGVEGANDELGSYSITGGEKRYFPLDDAFAELPRTEAEIAKLQAEARAEKAQKVADEIKASAKANAQIMQQAQEAISKAQSEIEAATNAAKKAEAEARVIEPNPYAPKRTISPQAIHMRAAIMKRMADRARKAEAKTFLLSKAAEAKKAATIKTDSDELDSVWDMIGEGTKEAAAEKLAAEKLAAEKLAAEKLAAEKLAAEKLAAEKLAAEKLAAEKLAAKKAADAQKVALAKATQTAAEITAVNKRVSSMAAAAAAAAAGETDTFNYGVWFEADFAKSKQKKTDAIAAFKADKTALTVGADTKISEEATIGAAYTNNKVNVKIGADKVKIASHVASIYGIYEFTNAISVDAKVKAGKGAMKFKGDKYKGNIYGAAANLNYRYLASKGVIITPSIGIEHENLKFKAKGKNAVKLHSTTANARIAIAKSFHVNGAMITPEIFAGIEHDLKSNNKKLEQSADSKKVKKAFGYKAGANVTLTSGSGYELSGGYEFYKRKKFTSHAGSLKLRVNF